MSTITWYGHSAFRLSDDNVSILIDPYFSVPSLEPEVIEDGVDLVLITHDHGDHTGDCVDICKKTHAKLGAIVGTAGALQKKASRPARFSEGRASIWAAPSPSKAPASP